MFNSDSCVFVKWQPIYAEQKIATFPVNVVGKDKKPCIKGYNKVGLHGSAQLTEKFGDSNALGFMCGKRNGITIIDIDSSDHGVVQEAVKLCGESPILWRTGSGNYAMPFRHSGEGRRIRPIPELPVDVLGGGFAVLPPSVGTRGAYKFLSGSVADFKRLPVLRSPIGDQLEIYTPLSTDRTIYTGSRDTTLFKEAMLHARYADSEDDVVDALLTRNRDCDVPLPDSVVRAKAKSAWGYEQRGENWVGRGKTIALPHDLFDTLIEDQDPLVLYVKLGRHHWGRSSFILANALGEKLHWGWRRFHRAVGLLVRHEIIACIHEGGNGPNDPPIYVWV